MMRIGKISVFFKELSGESQLPIPLSWISKRATQMALKNHDRVLIDNILCTAMQQSKSLLE